MNKTKKQKTMKEKMSGTSAISQTKAMHPPDRHMFSTDTRTGTQANNTTNTCNIHITWQDDALVRKKKHRHRSPAVLQNRESESVYDGHWRRKKISVSLNVYADFISSSVFLFSARYFCIVCTSVGERRSQWPLIYSSHTYSYNMVSSRKMF